MSVAVMGAAAGGGARMVAKSGRLDRECMDLEAGGIGPSASVDAKLAYAECVQRLHPEPQERGGELSIGGMVAISIFLVLALMIIFMQPVKEKGG